MVAHLPNRKMLKYLHSSLIPSLGDRVTPANKFRIPKVVHIIIGRTKQRGDGRDAISDPILLSRRRVAPVGGDIHFNEESQTTF